MMRKLLTYPIVLLMIAMVFSVGSVALVNYAAIQASLQVKEPITLTPGTVRLSLYPGETGQFNVTVKNTGPKVVKLTIEARVTELPFGGNASDISLSTPLTYSAPPGVSVAAVTVLVGNGAVAGNYTIALSFSRR